MTEKDECMYSVKGMPTLWLGCPISNKANYIVYRRIKGLFL